MRRGVDPAVAFELPEDPCPRPDKVRYSNERMAEQAMARLSRRSGARAFGLNVYRCGDHWHIGHRPVKMKGRW